MEKRFFDEAFKLAQIAYKKDEVPVGAVIVKDGKIIGKARNMRQKTRNATAHAEILAIEKACKKIKDFRLTGCDIYVTLEPCVMCLGAIINARIDNLYFAARINKPDTITSEELATRAGLNHNLKIVQFDENDRCGRLVSDYFAQKRKKNSKTR